MTEPILVHTDSALKTAMAKARGAMLADVLTEIQSAEFHVAKRHQLYWPNKDLTAKGEAYRDAFTDALVWVRLRLINEHQGASRIATKLINKANTQAFALANIANALIEIAHQQDMEEDSK